MPDILIFVEIMAGRIGKKMIVSRVIARTIIPLAVVVWSTACSTVQAPQRQTGFVRPSVSSEKAGYAIQLGAFEGKIRADRYISQLKSRGVDAYAFQAGNGLWTVRTGYYGSVSQARKQAEVLRDQNKIDDFFVANASEKTGQSEKEMVPLEDRIVQTARGYVGVRYKWGGTSAERGFDCSGFTMAVFRQHGISLPRRSRSQFQVGEAVDIRHLKKGDLVFFSTGFRSRISHVGIYSGQGQFIHASTRDRCIRVADMSKVYYRKRYRGARRVIHPHSG